MKHIKMFEMYTKIGFFDEICKEEFLEKIWKIYHDQEDDGYESYEQISVDFDKSDIRYIENVFEKIYGEYEHGLPRIIELDRDHNPEQLGSISRYPGSPSSSILVSYPGEVPETQSIYNVKNFLLIAKIEDDYFCVHWIHEDRFYVCDQLDGLKSCLEMISKY